MSRRKRRLGLNWPLLMALYGGVIVAPLVIAWIQGLPPRAWQDELSSFVAMAAFATLISAFVLSGRFQTVTGRVGIDFTMRLHQLSARLLTIPLLLHPFLYVTPIGDQRPWDGEGVLTLGLTGWSAITGIAAWILLAALFITAVKRDSLPFRYEAWRLSHGLGAWLIALFGVHHVLVAGRYSADPVLASWWIAMLVIASLTLLHTYVIEPLKQARRPYQLVSVKPLAERTFELSVQPNQAANGADALDFEAGQFVWLKVNTGPFTLEEHPFSISSSPADRPQIDFTIKAVGDFTRALNALPVGAKAFMDGPYGNFSLSERSGRGIAFLAGGVGIAPILSLLRQLCHERDPRPMQLVYGNRLASQIVYRDELDQLPERLDIQIDHVLSEPPDGWQGKTGRLDGRILANCLGESPPKDWLYFVGGPYEMIDSVVADLRKLGVPKAQIVTEKFNYD